MTSSVFHRNKCSFLASKSLAIATLSFILVATKTTAVYAFAPCHFAPVFPIGHSTVTSTTTTTTTLQADKNDVDDDYNNRRERDNNDDDWRAFRARLVRDGLPFLSKDNDLLKNSNNNTQKYHHRYAHESANLVEVGTILLSVPTTDLCQALEQQYWHRSVVLITSISKDRVNGDEEISVPKDQLAQGKGRGRWSYKGILLNRMTDLISDDDNGNEWNVWHGGDLASLDSTSDQTEFTCLHSLSDEPTLQKVSTKLVGKMHQTTLDHARSFCDATKRNNSSDFITFEGFCSWRPGQLEIEMGKERGEWVAISVDEDSIQDELRRVVKGPVSFGGNSSGIKKGNKLVASAAAHGLLWQGTRMWHNLFNLVGREESEVIERIPSGQLEFYDQMLNVWAEENLTKGRDRGNVDNSNDNKEEEKEGSDDNSNFGNRDDSSNLIGPGTLVRASSHVPNNALLYDQEFIRSTILILEETPEATVGLLLNHPLAAEVECVEGEVSPLPLRYGGPIDVRDWKAAGMIEGDDYFDGDYTNNSEENDIYEGFVDYINDLESSNIHEDNIYDDDSESGYYDEEEEGDDSPFIWLHRDTALGSRGADCGGGSSLGTSGVWLIQEEEVLDALRSGTLRHEDTMVFSGVCIWEKAPDLGSIGGGLREQIDVLRTLEVARGCNQRKDRNIIESVWNILSRRQKVLTKDSLDSNIDAMISAWAVGTSKVSAPITVNSSSREALSDAALRGWVAVNLLGDPLETLVEVKKITG